ncbi:MAG TPA: protein kinase, partial [Vicinamibacterales bacterium]|nr:protein kinase [Vicinamibacterales bacterium]
SALRTGVSARRTLDFARQIAEALAAAHDKGIVHRDLKPDNLFVSRDGRIKILDFGLAQLIQPPEIDPTRAADPTDTQAGVVLGTAGYMSPEQARGEPADHRSDIFSAGAILYEMAAGRPAFTRGSAAETMAAILKEDPATPFSPETPPALERVMLRCLEKNPEARFQSARDLAFTLQQLADSTSSGTSVRASRGGGIAWWRWASAAVLVLVLAALMLPAAPGVTPASPSYRLTVDLGAGLPVAPINLQFGAAAVLSPDGSTIAFAARPTADSVPQLYIRRLDRDEAVALPGTTNAVIPFFSPDGQSIAFFSGRKLKRIPVTGGAALTLADAPEQRGGWWAADDTIVFSPDRRPGTRLMRVAAGGGEATPLRAGPHDDSLEVWPQVLPGGRGVLYTSANTPGSFADADLVVQPLPDGARKVVQRGGYHGRYLPSGHLVYIHEGTLFATRFDLERLEVTSQPVPVLEGVRSNSITAGAQFSISDSGMLAYFPGPSVGAGSIPHWMNREGQTTPMKMAAANWFNISFAPDGGRVAMEFRDAPADIWIHEIARGTLARLTTDPAADYKPAWTPDGRRIVFASTRDNAASGNLYWQSADGTGAATRLTTSANAQQPGSWHPDGKVLVFEEVAPDTSGDLMLLPIDGSDSAGWTPGTPSVFVNDRERQWDPAFSPDGRWLAYASAESGRAEIYVRPYPGPGGKWQVSTGGGVLPSWSRTRPELLYGLDGQIMVVPYVARNGSFQAAAPAPWSPGRYAFRGPNRMFDLHPDGARVVLTPPSPPVSAPPSDRIVLIFNFFDELRRLASSSR